MNETDLTEFSKIYHMLNLHSKSLPGVIGLYQLKGKPVLAAYGYNTGIQNEAILQEAQRQTQHMGDIAN